MQLSNYFNRDHMEKESTEVQMTQNLHATVDVTSLYINTADTHDLSAL